MGNIINKLNKVTIPASEAEDVNAGLSTWKGGKLISLDMGDSVNIYIGHESETVKEVAPDGAETPKVITRAFVLNVPKPVTRARAINAAEMAAYDLKDAMDVASFNASLARKERMQEMEEPEEHDNLISWIKEELNKIGIR